MTYTLKHAHLESLFKKAHFAIPDNKLIFVGLRGATPIEPDSTDQAASHQFQDLGVNFIHMRCSILQWDVKGGTFAAFPGSTVPHLSNVQKGVQRGGRGVNQLATCYLRPMGRQDHRYVKGDHGLSSPLGPHRAFRNPSRLPVWRTADDAAFEGDDPIQFEEAFDNLHCARQPMVSAPKFSSNGCQVVAGTPGRGSSSPGGEQGPWKIFVDRAYTIQQDRFHYALFEQGEAQRMSIQPQGRAATVRFGSTGPLVKKVQKALQANELDIGAAGADGDFGFLSTMALRAFQLREFGPDGADLIGGPQTIERLGVS